MKYIKPIAVAAVLVLALGLAGRCDVDHAEREFSYYCHMVEQGHWPDFKNAQKECEDAQRRLGN